MAPRRPGWDVAETTSDRNPDDIWKVVGDLVTRFEVHQAEVHGLPTEEGGPVLSSKPESETEEGETRRARPKRSRLTRNRQ